MPPIPKEDCQEPRTQGMRAPEAVWLGFLAAWLPGSLAASLREAWPRRWAGNAPTGGFRESRSRRPGTAATGCLRNWWGGFTESSPLILKTFEGNCSICRQLVPNSTEVESQCPRTRVFSLTVIVFLFKLLSTEQRCTIKRVLMLSMNYRKRFVAPATVHS